MTVRTRQSYMDLCRSDRPWKGRDMADLVDKIYDVEEKADRASKTNATKLVQAKADGFDVAGEGFLQKREGKWIISEPDFLTEEEANKIYAKIRHSHSEYALRRHAYTHHYGGADPLEGQKIAELRTIDRPTWASVRLDPEAPLPPTRRTGEMFWDADNHCPSFVLEGTDTVWQGPMEDLLYGQNDSGVPHLNGMVGYIKGSQGQRPTIDISRADDRIKSLSVVFATESSIAANNSGYYVSRGQLRDAPTDDMAQGDRMWLQPTGGRGATKPPPGLNTRNVSLGHVIRSHPVTGSMFVDIHAYPFVDELSGVGISGLKDGHQLVFNGDYWQNKPSRLHRWPINPDLTYNFTLSYSTANRRPTLTPTGSSFDCWTQGERRIFTGVQDLPQHPNTTGQYFYYVDLNGVPQYGTMGYDLGTMVPICIVEWDAAKGDGWCRPELHTTEVTALWHQREHDVDGTEAALRTGFSISGYTYDLDTVAGVTFGVSGGNVWDEDARSVISALNDGSTYAMFYKSGASGAWTWDEGLTLPYKEGVTYPTVNTFTGGTWTQTEINGAGAAVYFNTFVVASPCVNKPQIILIQGQGSFASQALAEAQTWDSMDVSGLPWKEFVAIYQVIYKSQAAWSATTKKTEMALAKKITRGSGSSGVGASNEHNGLTGRDALDAHPSLSITDIYALSIGNIIKRSALGVTAAIPGTDYAVATHTHPYLPINNPTYTGRLTGPTQYLEADEQIHLAIRRPGGNSGRIHGIAFQAQDSASAWVEFGRVTTYISSVNAGSHTGGMRIMAYKDGAILQSLEAGPAAVRVGAGLVFQMDSTTVIDGSRNGSFTGLTATGNPVFGNGIAGASVTINGGSGTVAGLNLGSGGVTRTTLQLYLDNTLRIVARNALGSEIDIPVSIGLDSGGEILSGGSTSRPWRHLGAMRVIGALRNDNLSGTGIRPVVALSDGTLDDQSATTFLITIGAAAVGHNHDGVYAPFSHTHTISQITNLQSELDGKSPTSHTHPYLPIANPTYTGRLTGPTQYLESDEQIHLAIRRPGGVGGRIHGVAFQAQNDASAWVEFGRVMTYISSVVAGAHTGGMRLMAYKDGAILQALEAGPDGVRVGSGLPLQMGTTTVIDSSRNITGATVKGLNAAGIGIRPAVALDDGTFDDQDAATFLGTIGAAAAVHDHTSITGSAAKLTTPRSIGMSGDGAWSVSFDGSANVSGAMILASILGAPGYVGSPTRTPVFTYDVKGRLTDVSDALITPAWVNITDKPTTFAGLGVTMLASDIPNHASRHHWNGADPLTGQSISGLRSTDSPSFFDTTLSGNLLFGSIAGIGLNGSGGVYIRPSSGTVRLTVEDAETYCSNAFSASSARFSNLSTGFVRSSGVGQLSSSALLASELPNHATRHQYGGSDPLAGQSISGLRTVDSPGFLNLLLDGELRFSGYNITSYDGAGFFVETSGSDQLLKMTVADGAIVGYGCHPDVQGRELGRAGQRWNVRSNDLNHDLETLTATNTTPGSSILSIPSTGNGFILVNGASGSTRNYRVPNAPGSGVMKRIVLFSASIDPTGFTRIYPPSSGQLWNGGTQVTTYVEFGSSAGALKIVMDSDGSNWYI